MSMFSQSLIQGLINPSYADKLGTAGMLAGSMPDRLRLEQAEQEKKMREAQIAAMQASATGATEEAARKRAMAQQVLTGQVASAQDPGVAAAAQAGAMRAGVKPTDVKAAAGMATQGNQLAAWNQYLSKIGKEALIGVDPKEAAKIINEEQKSKTEATNSSTFASVGNFKDSNNNIYSVTEQRNKQGGVDVVYNAITPGAPKEPSGNLVPIGGSYNVSADEAVEMKGNEAGAKEFSKMQVAAAIQLPELQGSLANINATFDLLQTVPTGGPVNIANTAVESFLGTTSADKAELQVLLGNEMYKRLKPLFGGVISEGERQVIEGLYGSLRKGNEANEGILRALKRETESAVQKANMLRKAGSMDEYNTLLDKMYPETTSEGVNEVSWSDL